jgi:hypothetical protein
MSKKPFEILLTKIIKETLLLEEVNEEKLLYHIGLMTSAVRSPEGKEFIQSNLKRVVIGILKQIAIAGSPGEIPFSNLFDISIREAPETAKNLVTLAEIDQSADPDLHDILVAAMTQFINAMVNSISREIPMWLLYGDRVKNFNDQLIFIDDDGNEISNVLDSDADSDAVGMRFAYAPNEKVEFMKKFAQVLMEIADDRFMRFWKSIPAFELRDYDVGGFNADDDDF